MAAWSASLRTVLPLVWDAPDPAWLVWEDGGFFFCNERCRQLIGDGNVPRAGDSIGRDFPENWSELAERLRAAAADSTAAPLTPVRWPSTQPASENRDRWFYVVRRLIAGAEGENGGTWFELRESAAPDPDAGCAGQSRGRVNRGRPAPTLFPLLALMPAAVYTCDAEGRITYYNDRAAELWGRSPEPGESDQRFCGSFRLWRMDGTPLPHDETPMAVAVREGRSFRDEEVEIERPDGARVIVSVNIDPLKDEHGGIEGAINAFVDVTEHRTRERASREGDERLRLATETGKVGLWEWDIPRDHITWTKSLYAIHGVEPAKFDATAQGFLALVHPDDLPMVQEAIRGALEEQSLYELEFRIRRPDGTVAWVFTNATVLREAGEPRRMLGASVDITERKLAAEALRESEQRFGRFMRHLPGLAWIKDDQGRYVFVNDAAARVFGLPPEALHGRTDQDIFDPETAAQFRRHDAMARASDQGVQATETLRHADGRLHHSIVSKFIIPAGDGRAPFIGGMAIDITDRQEAERALQLAHDKLEERVAERTIELSRTNARFQAMFDQGLFAGLLALDGTWIDVNRSWLEASGYSRSDLVGRRIWDAPWWQGSPTIQAWIKIGLGEAMQGEVFRGETAYRTARGAERWLDLALMPIRDESAGAISFIVPTGLDTTERHRVEKESKRVEIARETDIRFRRLADSAPVLIWMADATNAGVWFNQQWLDFVGRSLEQERGDGWLENVHPDDAARCARLCGDAVAERRSFEMEVRLRRHDGEYRWMLDHGVPALGPDGEFSGFIGTCIDITERKQAEFTRHRLAAIVESSEDAIIGKTLDGIITNWNRGAQRVFGYTADEIIGKSVLTLFPPERQDEEPRILARIQRGEAIEHHETVRQRKDGSRFDVSLSVSPIRDDAGVIVGAAKILRDISERKRIDAELQRRERLYRAVGESINYGIWICDAAGRNLYASESFLQLVGLSQQECSDFGWGRVLHPDEAEATFAAWRESVRTGTPWEREHRVRGVDGAWHPILARGVPVRDDQGAIQSWVGINLDISRLKENETTLRRRTHQLEILNRVGRTLAVDRELGKLVQAVTDAGRELSGAAFGAFFYNVQDDNGDSYLLHALSGARKQDFERFGAPRSTPLFGPTFRGESPVRIADVLVDPRYGTMAPHHGLPRGHLPVRSYLAVPVVSAGGTVHGGLFFGHPDVGVFTAEAENLVVAVAAQAAIAIDNANLYRDMQRELRMHAQAELALRESEERFRTLADNIAPFAWTADRLGENTWYNRRWYEYTGLPPGDVRGKGWESVHHPEHLERIRTGFRHSLESGEPWEDTVPIRRHDGEWHWFLSRAVPIRDAHGRVLRWFGTNTDITAQKQAEAGLRRRGERMQLLSETLTRLLSAQDPEILEQELFPRVAEHLGADCYFHFLADDEARTLRLRCGRGIPEAAARSLDTLKYGEAIDGAVAQTRAAIVMENIQAADDAPSAVVRRWGLQTCACNPLLAGNRLLGTLSFASRKRARFDEDELEFLRVVSQSVAVALERFETTRALKSSEERFRTVADNIAQFAWTADVEGWIFWYNRRWFDYTGTTLEEMKGWGWMAVHHPEHVDRVVEKFARCIASGDVWEDTFPIRRRDGVYRWFLSRAVPIRDASGRVERWFGTNTDITEQREAELDLARARDEAVAASRAKDDFLAALSHELRTPLNPVLLLASDAADNPDLPSNVREDFETIRKNVSLEARLIDDLLDLTRISRGKLLLDFAVHDVHAILRDALATVRSDGVDKDVAIVLNFQAPAARVRADAVRLQQVFWNVLKNAVKFTPEGGRIVVTTAGSTLGDTVIISVVDSGIGMSAAELSRVFEAFAQGDHAGGTEAHRFGGLGLGLAISRMVIERHGGSIRAESPGPGRGSTFWIELPLEPGAVNAASPRATSSTAPSSPRGGSKSGRRVLLVEDHAPTRKTLERLLTRRGYAVAAAETVAGAVAELQAGAFDLLISDVGLPDGSGCDLMREHGRPRGLPGIALSGYGMEQDVAQSRAAGFAAHLIKPVNVAALDRAVTDALVQRGDAT